MIEEHFLVDSLINDMSKIVKVSLTVLNIVAIVGALATMGYFWGWLKFQQAAYNKGFTDALSAVLSNVKEQGEVKINNVTLVPKK